MSLHSWYEAVDIPGDSHTKSRLNAVEITLQQKLMGTPLRTMKLAMKNTKFAYVYFTFLCKLCDIYAQSAQQ